MQAPGSGLTVSPMREKCGIVMLDLDFADIRAYGPGECSGLIVLRLGCYGLAP